MCGPTAIHRRWRGTAKFWPLLRERNLMAASLP
jgi:hypothetical protein